MNEHPIIFSTPMVQAILEGRKSQTRRILKHQPITKVSKWVRENGDVMWYYGAEHTLNCTVACPYGKPGDILWVRESFRKSDFTLNGYTYKANAHPEIDHSKGWKPSIHMPRTAARIFLQIENIRVERLQEINMHDILAEGIIQPERYDDPETVKYLFKELWNKINGKRAPWESNPWVWVVEFSRINDQK